MSERYSRLFSLPENLYTEGSPVIIAAGALLKDNQTGRVIAQLKLRNISSKTIKAATISLSLMNTAGNPLGESVRYEYLDLSSARDTDFGSKSAIPLPDASTRYFSAAVAEVIFTDNSIWNANDTTWETLKSPETLTSRLDSEMVKQFQIEYGSGAKNFFLEQKGLWYCVCGAVNRREEKACHSCQKSICELRGISLDVLKEHKDQRLTEGQKQAEKEAAAAQERNRKTVKLLIPTVAVVIAFVVLLNTVIIPSRKYKVADRLLTTGEMVKAAIAFDELGPFKDSRQRSRSLWEQIVAQKTVATGRSHTVGLKTNGTVVAVGDNESGQCNVSDWTDIVAIAAGNWHTVGLKADGTVVAVGSNNHNQCNVSDWTDIVAIDACGAHTVGLNANGTVVAMGDNESGQCNVSDWTDIIAIAVGGEHTVGLKADGTVVAIGENFWGQCDVSDWTDIVAIDACGAHTVGLRTDGTVVATGGGDVVALEDDFYNQCGYLPDWADIVAVAAGDAHTVGLKANGTVVAVSYNGDGQCNVSDWTGIVAINAGDFYTVGLKADGTVMAVGNNRYGQCDISDWTDIKLP